MSQVSQSHEMDITMSCHMTKSHEECGKIMDRPYSSCISSVQEMNEDSIEFFLSTWTWRVIKFSGLSHYSLAPAKPAAMSSAALIATFYISLVIVVSG